MKYKTLVFLFACVLGAAAFSRPVHAQLFYNQIEASAISGYTPMADNTLIAYTTSTDNVTCFLELGVMTSGTNTRDLKIETYQTPSYGSTSNGIKIISDTIVPNADIPSTGIHATPLGFTSMLDQLTWGTIKYVTLSQCVTFKAGRNYAFVLKGVNGGGTGTFNIQTCSGYSACASNSFGTSGATGLYGVNSFGFFGSNITTGLQFNAVPMLSVTSTSITANCPDFGFFTPLCDGVVWFFVPNTTQLAANASSTYGTIINAAPFSYITTLHADYLNATGASSTPVLALDFQSMAPTNTAMGNFMPQNITFFSASTVTGLVPTSSFSLMRMVMAMSIYFGCLAYLYHDVRKLFTPQGTH